MTATEPPLRTTWSVPAGVQRRRPKLVRRSDVLSLVGAAGSAAGLTWLLFEQFTSFSGAIGWVVVGWLLFIALFSVLTSMDESTETVRDRLVAVIVHSLAGLILVGLAFVVVYVIVHGIAALRHWNFFTQDMSLTGPQQPLVQGGIIHGVFGTLEQIAIALSITIPLGLLAAVFLNEVPGAYSRFVRTIVEAMTALPSIVAGLFIYTTYILTLHGDKSGFAAALALSIMMLPIIIRSADVVIRLTPSSLREASLALGASQWHTVWHVVLPTARSGLATAVILGAARGVGETSPVLLTAGFTSSLNVSPFQGPQVSLPLLVFEFKKLPQEAMSNRAFGAAATLLIVVLVLFLAARAIGGRGPGVVSGRKGKALAAKSMRDAQRMSSGRVSAAPEEDADLTLGTLFDPAGQPVDRSSENES